MLGFNHLSDKSENTQVFYTKGTAWQTWIKPSFAKNIYIFCLGGGSSGRGGVGGANPSNRAGGGGGASGNYSQGTFSANLIPDVLYIQTGVGGTSGATSVAGALSYVSIQPNTTTQNILLASGATAPGTSGAPTAGVAGNIWSFTTGYVLPFLGLVTYSAGQAGANGGPTTGGVGNDITVSGIVSGGAGGAGVGSGADSAGGSVILSTFYENRVGGTASGGAGDGGLSIMPSSSNRNFILFTGGAGGASHGASTGGAGGNGGFGCGGGGGGAGITGGVGGKGGDGLVIITAW